MGGNEPSGFAIAVWKINVREQARSVRYRVICLSFGAQGDVELCQSAEHRLGLLSDMVEVFCIGNGSIRLPAAQNHRSDCGFLSSHRRGGRFFGGGFGLGGGFTGLGKLRLRSCRRSSCPLNSCLPRSTGDRPAKASSARVRISLSPPGTPAGSGNFRHRVELGFQG